MDYGQPTQNNRGTAFSSSSNFDLDSFNQTAKPITSEREPTIDRDFGRIGNIASNPAEQVGDALPQEEALLSGDNPVATPTDLLDNPSEVDTKAPEVSQVSDKIQTGKHGLNSVGYREVNKIVSGDFPDAELSSVYDNVRAHMTPENLRSLNHEGGICE